MSITPKKYVDIDSQDTPIVVYRDKDAVIIPLEVVPSTEQQTIDAPDAVDGYNPITVRAVNATIDSNILPQNIVRGVSILGVNGSYEGIIPTGTKDITANGTYDVGEFASAEVNVVQSKYGVTFDAWISDVDSGGNPKQTSGSGTPVFTGVRSITDFWLCGRFLNNKNIVGIVSFPDLLNVTSSNPCNNAFKGSNITGFSAPLLETVSGDSAFSGAFEYCLNLTSVNLNSLRSVTGSSAFYDAFRSSPITSISLPALKTINNYSAFAYAFYGCESLTSADLSALESVGGNYAINYMFYGCSALTSVNLSSLKTVENAFSLSFMFQGCTALPSINLSSLETINGQNSFSNIFNGCSSLSSVNLSKLESATGAQVFSEAFANCSSLETITFTKLSLLSGASIFLRCFSNCTSLQTVSFPALKTTSFSTYTNQFNRMLLGCTDVTVHFPSNLQSVIGSWDDVVNGFSGTNTTVLFDLPATE